MKSKIISFCLALCFVISSSFVAPKSHAVVGLILKKRVVTVIGGIGMTGGVALGTAGAVTSGSAVGWGAAMGAAALMGWGIILGGIGLVVLDDKQTVVDAEFAPVTAGFDAYSLEVYNSELEELNAVRKTIQCELREEDGMKKARELWVYYNGSLSAETVAIAEAQAANFINLK